MNNVRKYLATMCLSCFGPLNWDNWDVTELIQAISWYWSWQQKCSLSKYHSRSWVEQWPSRICPPVHIGLRWFSFLKNRDRTNSVVPWADVSWNCWCSILLNAWHILFFFRCQDQLAGLPEGLGAPDHCRQRPFPMVSAMLACLLHETKESFIDTFDNYYGRRT